MPLLVKICGLSTPETLDAALDAGADLVGFVFFKPSPRDVGYDTARRLAARVKGRAKKVALTVDADDNMFEQLVAALDPDLLQLHGHETPRRVEELKKRYRLPVMKALPVEEKIDLGRIADYAAVADWLVFDAQPPHDATRPGGLGKRFDWTLLRNLDLPIPFMLSGGLEPGNVSEAVAVTRAPAVDVSSGVECAPGEKDVEKIRTFIRAAREAEFAPMSNA